MIAVFTSTHEAIVVGLNFDGTPIDPDGTLFGPESGRDLNDYGKQIVDFDKGHSVHITLSILYSRVMGPSPSLP
jgi:hypothetical protein